MKIRTMKYHIQQAFTGLMKNRLMSFASMATVSACSFILIMSLCIVMNLSSILKSIETTVEIQTFFGDEVTDEQIADLKTRVEAIPYVKNVQYSSKDDALEWAKENFREHEDILSGFENDNPLSRSFEISVEDIKYQQQVVNNLEQLQKSFESEIIASDENENTQNIVVYNDGGSAETEVQTEETTISTQIMQDNYKYRGIKKIVHAQKEADILITVNSVMRIISTILIIILSIVSVAIIMNTIKLTVFIRRNEISIMKYVGATDWFIRWPFVIEGIVIGFVGAIIPCIICFFAYTKGYESINERLSMLKKIMELIEPSQMFSLLVPLTVALGVFLGVFASVTSMKKHLDV